MLLRKLELLLFLFARLVVAASIENTLDSRHHSHTGHIISRSQPRRLQQAAAPLSSSTSTPSAVAASANAVQKAATSGPTGSAGASGSTATTSPASPGQAMAPSVSSYAAGPGVTAGGSVAGTTSVNSSSHSSPPPPAPPSANVNGSSNTAVSNQASAAAPAVDGTFQSTSASALAAAPASTGDSGAGSTATDPLCGYTEFYCGAADIELDTLYTAVTTLTCQEDTGEPTQ